MLYFDTSFLTPLFLAETTSADIENFIRRLHTNTLAVSHWTRVEFSSLLAREVRMGGLTSDTAQNIDLEFERVIAESFRVLSPEAADFTLAKHYLRHHESGLRAADALHLAIAKNHDATAIYSLDKTMLNAGMRLGLPISVGINLS